MSESVCDVCGEGGPLHDHPEEWPIWPRCWYCEDPMMLQSEIERGYHLPCSPTMEWRLAADGRES